MLMMNGKNKRKEKENDSLFLSDLDGTLIHEESAMISSDDVQEIKKLAKNKDIYLAW